ncbi:MAG: aldehyde dehydrogenase [Gammaproteobacteria bacterium]|nr:MAG: aldehyde dehydrogenase [Gammaproteobacteria bacterium]
MTTVFKPMVANNSSSDGEIRVVNPYDLSVIAQVQTVGGDAIEQALDTAHKLFLKRESWLSVTKRVQVLQQIVKIMTAQADDLTLGAACEGGKPLLDSQVEITRAIDSFQICLDNLRSQTGQMIPMNINVASENKLAFSIHEPIGVVVAISAFNHPLNLIAHQIGPAIACGCPVIIKPAEDTPLSCFRLVKIVREAGLPDEWCQAFLPSSINLATKLVTDTRVAFFSFIGSAKVGWYLKSQLAAGTRCALEHGGAAPVIIAEDADLKTTIPKILKGGFYHAGQVCVSVQRVFVHQSISAEFVKKLKDGAKAQIIGDPTLEQTQVGPLIRPAEVIRIKKWLDEAIDEGAELITGGNKISDTCLQCTVLYNPSPNSKVSKNEIFGPVICVYPYNDIKQAISQANDIPYAFQAAVFTNNIRTANIAFKNLNASAVMINDHSAFRVDWMPFAGLKESGLGIGGIPYTMDAMQIKKMLVLDAVL